MPVLSMAFSSSQCSQYRQTHHTTLLMKDSCNRIINYTSADKERRSSKHQIISVTAQLDSMKSKWRLLIKAHAYESLRRDPKDFSNSAINMKSQNKIL